ncbi:cytochrome P450 [Ramicandelaber brevisporus]|nr:cytochrome P450 [Ramicandelaber brevisporus]
MPQPFTIAIVATALALCFIGSIVYNKFFHPLSHLPGPPFASCCDLWYRMVLVRGTLPFDLLDLHERYGPVVRFAPDRISFSSYADLRIIHCTHSIPKHRMYRSFEWGQEHTFSTNNAAFSKKRKRMLTPVFAPQSISRLEPLIYEVGTFATLRRMYRQCARSKLEGNKAGVDLYRLFFDLAFNTIGRLSFGEEFQMVGNEESDDFFVPSFVRDWWLNYVAPLKIVGLSEFKDYASKLVRNRLEKLRDLDEKHSAGDYSGGTNEVPCDILQLMIETEDPETGERMNTRELEAEAMVMIFAGSDTSGNTLTFTFDQLFANPHVMDKLEAEVLAAFPDPSEPISYRDAKEKLPYLEAVLMESMRIRSVGGTYAMREIPPGGRVVGGFFLPEGTMVGSPKYVIHNLTAHWDQPDVFWPERYLDGPVDVVAQRRQDVVPFSIGVRACIGRHLAMVEMTVAFATLIQHFKIRPPVENYKSVEPRCWFMISPKGKRLDAHITPRVPSLMKSTVNVQ